MPTIIDGVLEAALYAADLDAAEAFYGGVLGLRRIARGGDRHVFYAAGQTVLLIFNPAETERPPRPGPMPVPAHGGRGPGHVCLRVPSARLDEMASLLGAAGVAIEADFHWPGGARSIYVRDPAGNSVEFAGDDLWGLGATAG
ncbi:MAG: VOC family protein [Proteobacteria bacterium]|nr:VOC family protein [Pseudomonadota bacterium]MBS0574507.1 VOC family protein [Pseudomonadota bacterium]